MNGEKFVPENGAEIDTVNNLLISCISSLFIIIAPSSVSEKTGKSADRKSNRRKSSEGSPKHQEQAEDSVSGRWTKEEHERFLKALELYGRDWKKVQVYVATRSTTQTRSHAQKYFAKIEKDGPKEELAQAPTATNSPVSKVMTEDKEKIEKKKNGKRKLSYKESPKKLAKVKIVEPHQTPKSANIIQSQSEINQECIPVYELIDQPAHAPLPQEHSFPSIRTPDDVDFEFDSIMPEIVLPLQLPIEMTYPVPIPTQEEYTVSFDFSNVFG